MVKQFEVYWVDLNPTVGAEMQKIRPCVIVSPKELNDHLDTVIIVPITSAIHGYPYRVACRIMNRDGEMATDQIRTIDKRRLKSRISSLTSDEVTALQDVLRQMFCEQDKRSGVIELFPKDENRETEVNRDFRFFASLICVFFV